MVATIQMLYWPDMHQHIHEQHVKTCDMCQRGKGPQTKYGKLTVDPSYTRSMEQSGCRSYRTIHRKHAEGKKLTLEH